MDGVARAHPSFKDEHVSHFLSNVKCNIMASIIYNCKCQGGYAHAISMGYVGIYRVSTRYIWGHAICGVLTGDRHAIYRGIDSLRFV